MKISRRKVLNQALPTAVVGVVLAGTARGADQPHMEAALAALKTAQRELESATTDKGGHRAKAVQLVRQAINHVEQGITFDRRH